MVSESDSSRWDKMTRRSDVCLPPSLLMPPFPAKNASKFVKTARSCHLSFMQATIFSRLSVWACLLLSSYTAASPGSSNASVDELTLLSIKSTVLDPTGSLASWNASNHVCRWRGVTCGRRRPERVVALQMNSFALARRISPSLGNLSFLRTLDLGNNHLEGQIPQELGRLRRLQVLNLSTNYLEGRIPADLGNCTLLLYLNLENNHLQGEIPAEVGFLKDLLRLNLYANDLSGEIPPLLGNFSSIKSIDLGNNTFSGAVPSTLDRLPNLTFLSFQFNSLSGAIPPTIWNISSLRTLALMGNALNGTIPPNAFGNLPNLQVLLLSINQFDGHIPASVANASNLLDFEIAYNSFSGTVPPTVGDLQNLQYLVLAANRFEAEEPKDWTFMTALTNCSQLIWLELDINRFAGALPSSISNLSTSLTRLSLSQNEISGNIPANIGSLLGLQNLQLQNNYLIGALPPSLSTLQNLRELSFHNNNLSGQIPLSIGNLTQLNYLYLHYNSFSGRIPTTVGNLTSLLEVALANNNLEGTIPSSLFNIPTLSQSLYLSHNLLEGPIPPEIGNLKAIMHFGAEFNRLSGEIPATLGECRLLQQLNLQNNLLAGSIPTTLSGLNNLEILDLSSNNFSGQIPKFLGNMTMLSYLNLSFNNLVGEVPTVGVFGNATAVSIQGNDNLCGGIHDLRLPSCPVESFKKRHRFIVISVVVPLAATLVIISLLFFFFTWCKKQSAGTPSRASMQGHPQLSYSELVKATDGFSTANLLGNGTFGSVYKGNLEDESAENTIAVAVKVLKLQTPGAVKSFTIECEAMRNLRHRNLVRVITACSSIDFSGNDFKAIVFDFMPNGSLEEWLHPNTNIQREERHLSLVQRVSILFDVAYALDYLHFHCPAPIVHCDLKPSNVLLDADLVAHVGDFGLAKILEEGCSSFQPSMSSLGFRGTIGYAPPEYGAGNMVSIHGDIYSYGILILEMITGRRPTDNTFEHGLSLRKYVDMAVNTTRVMDIIHRELVTELGNESAAVDGPANKRRVGSLISLLQLGMLCSEEMASRRVSTKDIIKELHAITKALAQGEREREGKPSTFSF